jgi:hypothetical protein
MAVANPPPEPQCDATVRAGIQLCRRGERLESFGLASRPPGIGERRADRSRAGANVAGFSCAGRAAARAASAANLSWAAARQARPPVHFTYFCCLADAASGGIAQNEGSKVLGTMRIASDTSEYPSRSTASQRGRPPCLAARNSAQLP